MEEKHQLVKVELVVSYLTKFWAKFSCSAEMVQQFLSSSSEMNRQTGKNENVKGLLSNNKGTQINQ